jgi:glutathione S-transferase
MDSKFEVFYFPIRGRAEFVRLVLAAAKANWENKNVTDWSKEKFSTEGLLYKQVPMLIEHKSSGKELRLVQTGSIVRYIANKFNLVTDCPCKNALLDSYFEGLYEFINGVLKEVFSNRGKENYDEILKEFLKSDFVKNNISYQEDILASIGSNGHYMDDKLTYVDIIAYCFVDSYLNFPNLKGLFTKETTPNLLKVYETVGQNPDIAAYIKSDKRPAN